MKLKQLWFYTISFLVSGLAFSQAPDEVTKKELKSLIKNISDSLAYYYVSVKEGQQLGNALKSNMKHHNYDTITSPQALAEQLTKDLRKVNGDLHLFVNYTSNTNPDLQQQNSTTNNHGLERINFLKNDIAYLKIKHFSNATHANTTRQKIAAMMPLLGTSKALIIDVRDNNGGAPYVASYLISYLFEKKRVKLAELYTRFNDHSYSIYTEPFISGETYPNLPVYVLVNKNSASAAEELAFWLQNKNRAIIIGENTSGAGYGAMEHRLNDRFSISISSEVERDPDSKKGFQIVGVQPDILIDNENALSVALELAQEHIENQEISSLSIESLHAFLEHSSEILNEATITAEVMKYYRKDVLNHITINTLGYEYLSIPQKAKAILKANTILHPFYPNSFDSYADALFANRDYELARENYQNAVTLARLKSNPNIALFEGNMKRFEQQLDSILQNENAIKAALMHYIEGTSNGEPKRLEKVFHPDLNLYSVSKTGALNVWKGQDYISGYKEGKRTDRIGKILSIDYENNAAIAKVEIKTHGRVYIDYFLLLKLNNNWTIIHKSYTQK